MSCLPPKTLQGGLCEDSVEYLTGVTYEAFIRLLSNQEVAANTLLEEVAPSVLNIYQEYLIELGVLNQVYHHKLYYRESTNNASFVNDFFLHFNVYFDRKHKTSNSFVNGLLFLDKEPHLFVTEDDSDPKTFKMMLDYHKNWEIETHSNADFNRLPDNSLSDPFNHIPIYFRPLTQRLPDFVSKSKPILITKLLGCPLIELNKDEFEYVSVAKELYMTELEATVQPGSFLLRTNMNGRSVYMCAGDYLEIATSLVINRTIDTHLLLNTTNSFSVTPQGIMSLICTVFSLICLILTLITYVIFSELRTQPGINNIGLVISLILAQALFQFGINQVDTLSTWICQMIGVMIHFFWLMVMFWANVCTFHMFKVFAAITKSMDSTKSIKQTLMYTAYTVVSSLIIILITIIVSLVHPDFEGIGYGGTYCYITVPRMVGYTLAIPIGAVIVINLTLFVLVIIKVARMPTVQSDIKHTRNWMLVYAKLSTITGATWIVGFLYYFKELVVLEYVHILLNGSQGVFLFLSFICNRRVLFMYKNKLKAMKKTFSEAPSSRQKTYSAGT